ncbi:Vesicle-associated protein 2-2 [Morus notabilis]|uniref:Vesicle-associated protein 2-2 n=1 Tax=Morus notabilis TaxID=981085 RepID=W9RCG3_9ROSA|nr:Vesicle-associated protein 2-2 [Morus notabilis]
MSKLLEIQPKELNFTIELKKQSSCSVRLANVTNYYVAFKVKTTSPKRYCVRPNVGIVMPNSTCEFAVTMQVPRTFPLDLECKDKFLIQSTIVSPETTDEQITASMFVKDGGKYVEEKKLRVILLIPPDSPTLSPINGALNQGLGRETSFSKDQSLNGVENTSKSHMVTKDVESVLVNIKESKPAEDKLKPVKNVEFKLENDVKELKPAKGVEELKPAKDVEELKPAKDVKELNPAKDVEELTPAMGVEESKPVKGVEVLNLAKTVEDVEELKLAKDVELKNVDIQELKLVKDVEDIKSKLSEFELKLQKAELGKRGVKTVQVGFPLLFVCMVALISVVLGYRLHP